MSEEDLEGIRAMNDAIGRADLQAIGELLDEDVVWEHNPGVGSPEEGLYRGREAVVRLFERILEPWQYMRLESVEVNELEHGAYLVKGEIRAKHRTSDLEVVTPYEQRLEIRDALLVKGRVTMEAAGVE